MDLVKYVLLLMLATPKYCKLKLFVMAGEF